MRSKDHGKLIKMEGLLTFSAQEKAKSVIWYHKTGFTTQNQLNHCTTYADSPSAGNYILQWVQKFDEHGAVGNARASGRHGASSKQEERVFNYFIGYPCRSLRRAQKDLTIKHSSIHDITQNRLHMFPYKLHVVQRQGAPKHYSLEVRQ